jgi:shikimate 5-dehydrogenase
VLGPNLNVILMIGAGGAARAAVASLATEAGAKISSALTASVENADKRCR